MFCKFQCPCDVAGSALWGENEDMHGHIRSGRKEEGHSHTPEMICGSTLCVQREPTVSLCPDKQKIWFLLLHGANSQHSVNRHDSFERETEESTLRKLPKAKMTCLWVGLAKT